MTEQIFQYAEELMQYQQENDLHGDTLEQKVIRLNEQFSIVSTRCMPAPTAFQTVDKLPTAASNTPRMPA